ncbi:ABC transporter ATP-binding protein [Jeotgalibaca sp. MA1X17-3]|uniref:ABC transporter ATP-binding protein n=1 Tax=Jeotgalibaca sp. MA1X17-3 TaxID=2908211 RepID=UPI001F438BD3|nr:ABC transporter ATP-binding protein [Jeotgalibaca sp. MA1X17-3]UJF15687.1 ABC transporter ATP-binding protein [Jeotgalibaca sp. MA1X17-3]
MITFENVTKKYEDGTIAVDGVDLKINEGEFFVIIGPSGSGKTTLLKMINRLIALSDGTVRMHGKKISEYNLYELRWDIGYVLQQIALFPHMTIEENIEIVPELMKWPAKKMKSRANELMTMVGLEPEKYASRKPHELSGGEQQRVGVIRALAADPKIILMDEPFSALDPISREKLQDDLLELKKQLKKTTVFVTHDREEAFKLADRICIMKDGKVVQVGTPEELLKHPVNEFVFTFLGGDRQKETKPFKLETIMQPMNKEIKMDDIRLPYTASLEEVVHILFENDALLIEKEDKIIGMIDRSKLLLYLAENTEERGNQHE